MTETEQLAAVIKRQGAQIAAMMATPSTEDANQIAKAWDQWDSLYQMLGDRAPHSFPGEKPRAYLRRLADGVRKYTTSFRAYQFHDAQQSVELGLVTDKIFTEALAYSKKPTHNPVGQLREIVTVQHGKTRVEFVGDPRTPWLPFMHPRKFAVTKINRPQ